MLRKNISFAKWALRTPLKPLFETWWMECMTFITFKSYNLVSCLSWKWIGMIYTDISLIEAFKADCTS